MATKLESRSSGHLRRPRPTPEPPYLENLPVKELWSYSEPTSRDVGTQAQLLPSVEEHSNRIIQIPHHQQQPQQQPQLTGKLLSSSWPSQPPQIKQGARVQRGNTFYINRGGANMLVTTSFIRKDSGKEDRLPVVELKPFVSSTNKEWIPAKSRAWEEDDPGYSHHQQTTARLSENATHNSGFPDAQKIETPRQADTICSKAFPVPVEKKTPHPKLKDVAEGTVIQREVSFIPKIEREKTTSEDIKQQQHIQQQQIQIQQQQAFLYQQQQQLQQQQQQQQLNMYSQYPPFSFISRELTDYDIKRQNSMKIHGQKMKKLPPNGNPLYMDTWQMYKMTNIGTRASSKLTNKQQLISSLQAKMEVTENTYLDENIYDCFDRSVTLPSIMVKPANCKSRTRQVNRDSPGKERSSSRGNNRTGYRLGVVNSLDVMSMCGRPVTVEQNLTSHLKNSLQELKRTKDSNFLLSQSNNNYMGGSTSAVVLERPLSNKLEQLGTPTIGEMMIREGRRNNGAGSNQNGGSQSAPAKRSKLYAGNQSRSTSFYYDSGFEDSCAPSPTKSVGANAAARTSRMQMHHIINENVKAMKENSAKGGRQGHDMQSGSEVQLDDPPTSLADNKQSQADDICSVDSGELDPRSTTKSVKSSRSLTNKRRLTSEKSVVFDDNLTDDKNAAMTLPSDALEKTKPAVDNSKQQVVAVETAEGQQSLNTHLEQSVDMETVNGKDTGVESHDIPLDYNYDNSEKVNFPARSDDVIIAGENNSIADIEKDTVIAVVNKENNEDINPTVTPLNDVKENTTETAEDVETQLDGAEKDKNSGPSETPAAATTETPAAATTETPAAATTKTPAAAATELSELITPAETMPLSDGKGQQESHIDENKTDTEDSNIKPEQENTIS